MDPRHLEDHQASPEEAAKGLSLAVLVNEVASRQVEPYLCSEEWLATLPCHLLPSLVQAYLLGPIYFRILFAHK